MYFLHLNTQEKEECSNNDTVTFITSKSDVMCSVLLEDTTSDLWPVMK